MPTSLHPPETVAKLLDRLGGISPDRVHWQPLPGPAVEDDIERCKYQHGEKHLSELVDGTLVEKVAGPQESQLAVRWMIKIGMFLKRNPLFILLGADAGYRLDLDPVRPPDVGFISQSRLATRKKWPKIVPFGPDLGGEIISPGNAARETGRKLREDVDSDVKLAWHVYPQKQTVSVFRGVDPVRELTTNDSLDGEEVLPGFTLSIRDWCSRCV
jgi:Uma2 family endonuclease